MLQIIALNTESINNPHSFTGSSQPLCEPPGAREKPEKAELTPSRFHKMFGMISYAHASFKLCHFTPGAPLGTSAITSCA